MKTIIHIAGTPVRIGPLCRQLCAYCGQKLYDQDMRHLHSFGDPVPTPAVGFNHFKVGAYVSQSIDEQGRTRQQSVVADFDLNKAPPNGFCGESDFAAVASEAIGNA